MPLAAFLAANPASIFVEIAEAKGSTPRERGAFMLVSSTAIWGTIGGGQFEYMAIDNARAMLSGSGAAVMDIPLGPEIGQCCGGRTKLVFTVVTSDVASDLQTRIRREEDTRPEIYLFGCGHVGLALARALAPLPFAVTVIETRAEALEGLPPEVSARLTAMPEAHVAEIAPGGAAVILTHDHALDFLIAERALSRGDLAYVGMIGSATKRATFSNWLQRQTEDRETSSAMISRLTLPVGNIAADGSVKDKRPAVIAALVSVELLHCVPARQPVEDGLPARSSV
ncbi:xanthine dehydrogenase accessory protein XdhC [Rhizobium sp. CFBP 8752]|uniref:xanthine dehydrogenase accessory protein XdhC n=1 Tax=Rhizobium sp. CFBP 8752 TaxID=2775301 RepID=UPI001783EC6B|nr:xanthine dehydrogenase accessory protein XdhC [Rhizobium sp. CFBP 8752]MBD8662533.1 xanthine dehydrogenase accessory protein XdhC [Rhizobium sp. CFBP 8752]